MHCPTFRCGYHPLPQAPLIEGGGAVSWRGEQDHRHLQHQAGPVGQGSRAGAVVLGDLLHICHPSGLGGAAPVHGLSQHPLLPAAAPIWCGDITAWGPVWLPAASCARCLPVLGTSAPEGVLAWLSPP